MNIVKPVITRDLIARSGYICRSTQPGLSCWREGGSVRVTGTGDTVEDAYAAWSRNLEAKLRRYAKKIIGEKP